MANESLKRLLGGRPVHVLYGGFSNERPVSLVSGESVAAALEGAGHRVVRVDVDKGFASEGNALLAGTGLAFIVLHGEFGEDGEIQEILEGWGTPYTGSGPQASRLAMDKALAKKEFAAAGVPTPRWEGVPRSARPDDLAGRYGLPLVIKPSCSGSSIGVTIVREAGQIAAALAEAGRHSGVPLVEEFIPGRELTVGILGDAALPVIELRARKQFYDYEAKYADDAGTEYLCPAPVDAAVAAEAGRLSLAAHRALGCRHFSRVDLRLTPEGRLSVLEVNTIPGFTSHSLLPKAAAAAGLDFRALVERIAAMALGDFSGGHGHGI
ncbi:MAG TPA: D-alanine--D-alanine ligase [Planctomycetota bacterium]|nr:D-alanine--D-alanine ligase [Planctomycetota bacterium]